MKIFFEMKVNQSLHNNEEEAKLTNEIFNLAAKYEFIEWCICSRDNSLQSTGVTFSSAGEYDG